MARILRALALMLIIVLAASACSAGNSSNRDYVGDDSGTPKENYDPGDTVGSITRQVIYEVYLKVSVAEIDKTVKNLDQRVKELGGYVSDSLRDEYRETPTARITYRIPQAKYSEFLAYARSQGQPGRESVNSTDVTEEFIDLESRLANRQVHEERLLQMLAKTATITELLSVERELARIREDIEVIQGRLRYLNDRTSMAKVEIYLDQLPGETNIPGLRPVGIRETLRRSLKALVTSSTMLLDFLSFLLVALAALLPISLPVVLIVGLILYRRRRKKTQGA